MGWGGKKGGKDAYSASGYSANDVMFALEVMGAIGGEMGKGMGKGMHNMGGMMGMKGGKGWYDGYEGAGKGKHKGGKAKGGKAKGWPTQASKKTKGQVLELPWKTRLAQAYSQEHRQPPTKGQIVYTSVPVEGEGFMCTVSCDKFSAGYETEEVHDSQKAAEEAAAMAALEGEFPKAYEEVPAYVKKKGAAFAAEAVGVAASKKADGVAVSKKAGKANGTGAVKRKAPPSSDAKTQLNGGFAILVGRPLTKADFEYTVAEVDGSSVATLTLHCVEEGSTSVFEGESAAGTSPQSKKQAEQYAAAAALKVYQDQIDAKLPEHTAMKEQRKAEKDAKAALKKAKGAEPAGLE